MRRKLKTEKLEDRMLLAGPDVNLDGIVSANDALIVINAIESGDSPFDVDVNGTGVINNADAVDVIAVLRLQEIDAAIIDLDSDSQLAALLPDLRSLYSDVSNLTTRIDVLIDSLLNEPPPVNLAPVVEGPLVHTFNERSPTIFRDMLRGASDPEGQTLEVMHVVIDGDQAGISVFDDTVEITPSSYDGLNDGESAVITISYGITDGNMVTPQTMTVTIEGIDDPVEPPEGDAFLNGAAPVGGNVYSEGDSYLKYITPDVMEGERLSGVVTVAPKFSAYMEGDEPYRILIEGIEYPGGVIDTTSLPDKTYAIQVQYLGEDTDVQNGTEVVVINNSGVPLTSLNGQAVVQKGFYLNFAHNTSAWGRVNVDLSPATYPNGVHASHHPPAQDDDDRVRLATEELWWVDGASGQSAWVGEDIPLVMKNAEGDYFIKQYTTGKWHPRPEFSYKQVEASVELDGHRGEALVSGYTTYIADTEILNSEFSGWLGLSTSGRLFTMDITGEVITLLGPRNIPGVIPTDFRLDEIWTNGQVTLDTRIADGEKEWVGDDSVRFNQARDLSHYGEGKLLIASKSDGLIHVLNRNSMRVTDSIPLEGVTSVWAPNGNEFYAVSHLPGLDNDGLYHSVDGADPVLVAEFDSAYWVRGDGDRVFIMGNDRAVREYTPSTGELVVRIEPTTYETEDGTRQGVNDDMSYGAVDINGTMGPKGWLYMPTGKTGNQILRINTDTWESAVISKDDIQNHALGGTEQTNRQPTGHYGFSIAPHNQLTKFITSGTTDTSPYLWTGHLLTDQVALDPPYAGIDPEQFLVGEALFEFGKPDEMVGLNTIYGAGGFGYIGYTVDKYRSFRTFEEAKPVILADLDEIVPESITEYERVGLAAHMFMQRHRAHF